MLGMYEGLHASFIVELGRVLHALHLARRCAALLRHHSASLICVLCSAPLPG